MSRHYRLDDGSFFWIYKDWIYEKEINKYADRSLNVFIDDGYATHPIKE
jgi:hypothetical protein